MMERTLVQKSQMRKRLLKIPHVLWVSIFMLLLLVPFYIALLYAIKPKTEINVNRLAWPVQPTFENFITVITKNQIFLTGYKNSLISTIPTVLLLLFVTSMAAYVLARNKGRFYEFMYTVFTIGILIPFQCIMLSLYLNFFKLGLTSNNLGYIIVRVGLQVSISVLVITSFVKTIPKELEEAACIDGAGQMRTFWQIVFPLMRPVNVTQLVLNTLFCWNDYNVAIVMLRTNNSKTLPLAQIIYFNENTAELNYAFAFFLMTMIPILILYFSMQRFIVRGIMSGAVKG